MSEKGHTYPAGYRWRFNAPSNRKKSAIDNLEGDGRSYFDELVVDKWLHIEHLDDGKWWIRIGEALNIHATITEFGDLHIAIDDYEGKGKVADMLDDETKSAIIKKLYSGKK